MPHMVTWIPYFTINIPQILAYIYIYIHTSTMALWDSGDPLVNVCVANWKDPPCYSWENQLFRLGHGFNSYVNVYQRVIVSG